MHDAASRLFAHSRNFALCLLSAGEPQACDTRRRPRAMLGRAQRSPPRHSRMRNASPRYLSKAGRTGRRRRRPARAAKRARARPSLTGLVGRVRRIREGGDEEDRAIKGPFAARLSKGAEGVAPFLDAELQSRRRAKEHHLIGPVAGRGVRLLRRSRRQRAAHLGDVGRERASPKIARSQATARCRPPFALPPMIQCTRGNGSSAFSAASAFVAFESLMKSAPSRCPTCSMRCARPGKLRNAAWSMSRSSPRAPSARIAAAAFCALCAPRSEAMPARSAITVGVPARWRTSRVPSSVMPVSTGMAGDRDGRDGVVAAGRRDRIGDGAAVVVVDRDDRRNRRRDEPRLDRGVVRHRAVAVEMVRRQVHEHADARVDGGREVDLERRAFDDVDAVRRRRRQLAGSASRCCRPSRPRGRST